MGSGGHYLSQPSTRASVYSGEWFLSQLGAHEGYETWRASRKGSFLEEVRERADQILATHEPLPLDEGVEQELERILESAARNS